jgi:hypothetical protein
MAAKLCRQFLFSLIFLASFPRFWGDMHFNPKDVPEMVFFGLVILHYYSWFKQPNLLKAIGVGILFSMALGTKLNSIFIPFILLLGIFKWEKGLSDIKTNLTHFRKYSTHYLLMLMSFLITYYFSWPYIWKEPLRAISYFKYMLSQGGRGFSGTPGEALLQTITTLPEMMLIFLVIGIVFSMLNLRKESSDWNRLLLVWLMIPLIRSNLPGIANFDGIRHFLEFLPPAAMLAGWGLVKSIEYLSKIIPVKKSIIVGILISFLLLNIAEINIRYNPFQHLYYNRLIGGLQGAQQVFGPNEATDYWGVSYRKGIEWINENAPEGAGLYTAVAPHLVDITAELWLRPDINVIEESSYHSEKDQVSELYVMFITRPVFYDEIAKYCVQNLDPVYTIEVDGVDVMEIYDYE